MNTPYQCNYSPPHIMDVLLHPPKPNDEIFDKPHKRVHSSYTNLSQRFKVPQERRYHVQYSHIYFLRLSKMKSRLIQAAKRRWGMTIYNTQLID